MGMYDNEFVPQMYSKIAKWSFIIGGGFLFLKFFGFAFEIFELKTPFVVLGFILLGVGIYFKFFTKKQ